MEYDTTDVRNMPSFQGLRLRGNGFYEMAMGVI